MTEELESGYSLQVGKIGFTSELKVECERKRQMPGSMLELAFTHLGELIVLSLLTSAHSDIYTYEGCMVAKVCYVTKVNLIIQTKKKNDTCHHLLDILLGLSRKKCVLGVEGGLEASGLGLQSTCDTNIF